MPDPEPFDWGDIAPTPQDIEQLEREGVWGVVATVTMPPCPCCGTKAQREDSLWSVAGDAAYLGEVMQDVADEAMRMAYRA